MLATIKTCCGQSTKVDSKELRMLQQRQIVSSMCRCGAYHTTTPVEALHKVLGAIRGS